MKIKVLYIIPTLALGGAEMLLVNTLNNFIDNNYELHLIVIRDKLELLPKITNERVKIHLVNVKYVDFCLKIWTIISIVHSIKPDIIHSHLYNANILSRFLKIFNVKTKLINHYHGLSKWMSHGKLFVEITTKSLVDRFIVVSKKSYDLRIKREKFIENKTFLVYNFVSNFPEIVYTPKSDNIIRFGMACRLVKLKNIPAALNLVKFLISRGLDVRLHIAGEGPEFDSLKQLVLKLELSEKVTFLGYKNNLSQFYNEIDYYIISSDTEDLPLSMIEAMSFGKSIISKDVGGIREVLEGGIGLVIDDLSEHSFELVYSYIISANLNKAFLVNRQLIFNEFLVEHHIDQLKKIYQQILI